MESLEKIHLKYLLELVQKFENIKMGIRNNKMLWERFNISEVNIDEHINSIFVTGKEIEKLKRELSEKLLEARELKAAKKKIIEQYEKRAIGLHADDEIKLNDYGI